jgi:hypothetical protein
VTGEQPRQPSAAEDVLIELQGQALAAEAADHLAGRAWVTVWHGELETPDDARLIEALAEKASGWQRQWPGCVLLRQAGSDYTAIQFGPVPNAPTAEDLAGEFAAFAASIAPHHPALERGTWWWVVPGAPSSGPPRLS